MKITEIFELQNADSNLILGQNIYILIHDYEVYKNRLQDHSAALELLTQRALNLSLFRGPVPKLKFTKPSYPIKNEKLQKGVVNGELSIIKKLLSVNLRSFKIMQKLFSENEELQMLLNDSRVIARKQKQKIERVKRENEILKKTETQLKRRLESVFRQLNQASRSFLAGFQNDNEDDSCNEVSLAKDVIDSDSQKLEFAFNFSSDGAYRRHDDASKFLKINNVHQELSYRYDSDIALGGLKIRLTPGIPAISLNNFFDTTSCEYPHGDCQIKYPLLVWQTKRLISEESDSKQVACLYKIDKEIQNAIRLHCVNSTIWRSFLVMKTIREFEAFNRVSELIKAVLLARDTCESEEPPAEEPVDQTMLFQSKNFDLHSSTSDSSYDWPNQSSSTSNEIMEASNRGIEESPKGRYPRLKVFYTLKRVHVKVVNGNCCQRQIKKCTPVRQCSSTTAPTKATSIVSIGVGDGCIAQIDRASQVDKDIFLRPTLEMRCSESNMNVKTNEIDKNDTNDKNDTSVKTLYSSGRDFKKSLKSLEDVIKSCQQKCEQESTTKLREKLRRKGFNDPKKNVNNQSRGDTKVKEVKKKNRSTLDSYIRENYRKTSQLPEMSKMYQIILENRLPRGVSFEYLTPDKSKVQLLFVGNSRDTKLL